MVEPSDRQLLAEYISRNSQEAFATLVRRHVNLVYAAAFRQVGNFHHAQEVTQVVFLILATKAARLKEGTILSGWLYQTARLTSASFLRGERRRQHREHEAFMQSTLRNSPTESGWEKLAPLLDEAMGRLGEMDRNAIVLRFFEVRPVSEVAAALGLEEWAVRKRLERAVEKLRKFFAKRGVAISSAAICVTLSASAAAAAPPAALAGMIAATAATKGTVDTCSTLTLLKTTLKIMAWTKAKTAIIVGAGVLLAAGSATVTIKEVSHYHEESLWDKIAHSDLQDLENAPAGVSIRQSAFPRDAAGMHESYGKVLGIYQPFETLIARAYDASPWRVLALSPLPAGEFDYMATTSQDQRETLQEMIKSKFGFFARHEMRETDVLELRVKRPNAAGLKPSSTSDGNSTSAWETGSLHRVNGPISFLIYDLENCLQMPVIDRTGLVGRFDYDLKWDDAVAWDSTGRRHFTNPDGLKRALLNELGLELVSARESLDILVVTKK